MKKLNKIKSDYEGFEIKPSAELWSRIDEQLSEEPEIQLKQSFKWWKYSAAAIVLMISTAVFIYFNQSKRNSIPVVQSTERNNQNPVEIAQKVKLKNTHSGSELPNKTKELLPSHKDTTHDFNAPEKIAVNTDYTKTPDVNTPAENPNPNNSDNHSLYKPDHIKTEDKIVYHSSGSNAGVEKPEIKEVQYIRASDLLTGREFDKARKESHNKKVGGIDIDKIKGPNSLKIIGITIYSNSEEK